MENDDSILRDVEDDVGGISDDEAEELQRSAAFDSISQPSSRAESQVTATGRRVKRRKLASWVHEYFVVDDGRRFCRHCL